MYVQTRLKERKMGKNAVERKAGTNTCNQIKEDVMNNVKLAASLSLSKERSWLGNRFKLE